MSSEPARRSRRLALVLAWHCATAATPPGVDSTAFADSCLADSYEVLADLVGVTSGIVGDDASLEELLWPGALWLPVAPGSRPPTSQLASQLTGRADQLVLIPADVPDLPGLVIAKVFKALQRAEVCVCPERGGTGCAALGLRLPWAGWLPDLDLERNPLAQLRTLAPAGTRVAVGPDWPRLRSVGAIARLDPGLEGWESTRALLSGVPLGS